MRMTMRMSDIAGTVYLVGAGPGNAGLITVRGVDCLRRADVVVYDYLANETLLGYAPSGSELIYVGKSAGCHAMPQQEINELLAARALQGKTVVRLKGGDPFVFGRGGEEAEHLVRAGVAFEIVPGVTSAIAGPAYAGIPVTQRGINTSFHVITGHEDADKTESSIDWPTLAKLDGTLVFLMGVSNLARIAAELIRHGRAPETPVALIRWATLPEQDVLVSDLSRVAEDAAAQKFAPPVVTVIGEVVGLRPILNWVGRKPLFGVRAAATRPADQCASLREALVAAGADVAVTPTIRIKPRDFDDETRATLRGVSSFDWLVFTSVNGVKIFFDLLLRSGLDARSLANAQIAAIGEKTAETLLAVGIRADCMPAVYVQEELARAIAVQPRARVLIPRAAEARAALEQDLEQRGAHVTVLPVYDTVADENGIARLLDLLKRKRVNLITFTSSSTVDRLADQLPPEDITRLLDGVTVASIGPVTTATVLRRFGVKRVIEAGKSTADGLAQAILEHYAALRHGARDELHTPSA